MPIGVASNTLDFDIIEDYNPQSLVFLDKSIYSDINGPTNAYLDILLPGFTQQKRVAIVPNRMNVINSALLSLTCFGASLSDLPDGVYVLTYRIRPHDTLTVTKVYLKSTTLWYGYENMLLALDNTDCAGKHQTVIKNQLLDFNILLDTARAYARQDNVTKAGELYQKASKLLTRMSPKTHC